MNFLGLESKENASQCEEGMGHLKPTSKKKLPFPTNTISSPPLCNLPQHFSEHDWLRKGAVEWLMPAQHQWVSIACLYALCCVPGVWTSLRMMGQQIPNVA